MKSGAWSIPRAWTSETAFILGGGSSLKGFDASVLRGLGRVISIKEAGLTLAPWADVLFWADPCWIDTNYQRLHLHKGAYKISRAELGQRHGTPPIERSNRIAAALVAAGVKYIPRDPSICLSADPRKVGEPIDSGGSAINVAYLFGCSPIVLLGFDFRPVGHWHDRTIVEPEAKHYERFLPPMMRMAAHLKAQGVRVINATPDSALPCFDFMPLEEVLSMDFAVPVRTVFQTRGRRSTFTPDGGAGVTCRAIRQGGGQAINVGPVSVVVERTSFHVRRAEIAAPAVGDVLTFGGSPYTIDAVQPVENDPDQLMWSLETSWGAQIAYRSISGAGITQSPPQAGTMKVAAAALSGAVTLTIGSTFAVGKLVPGDAFVIDGDDTEYTVAGPVTASSNKFTGVPITPALVEDADLDAEIAFTFARDYSVRGAVAAYGADEMSSGVLMGDRRLVVLQSAFDDAGMADPPKPTDRVTLEGRQFVVQNATALYQDGIPLAWDIQVRG